MPAQPGAAEHDGIPPHAPRECIHIAEVLLRAGNGLLRHPHGFESPGENELRADVVVCLQERGVPGGVLRPRRQRPVCWGRVGEKLVIRRMHHQRQEFEVSKEEVPR